MKKTIEMKVTACDLRSTFGNVVDYVIVEVAERIKGLTEYDVISYNRDTFGCHTWEITLKNREVTTADVYIQYYGMHDETLDDEVVAEVSIELELTEL